jgi:hypothetical protein
MKIFIHGILLAFLSSSSVMLNASSIKMQRIGERGHPSLNPLDSLKKVVGLSLTKGPIHGEFVQAPIQLRKFSLNPNFLRTLMRNLCMTLSKELVKSTLMTIPFSPIDLLEWIFSWTRTMLSTIFCFSINPPWLGEMRFWRRGLIRFALILEINLYETLHNEI